MALKKRETQKAEEEKLVKAMRKWQAVEDESIRMTKTIQAKTDNPLVRLVMEIIAHDSAMHRRVQQFVIDSVETSPIQLAPEDLEKIWDHIEQHIAEEKKTLELADEARLSTRFFVQRYLLNYLLEDERKHDLLLERLEEIKNRMYPYA
jgi:transcriptional regulator GlxA family with amidase domain